MRFYVSPESIFPEKNIIEIRDTREVHHIRDVMRLKKGTRVCVFDGRGKVYSGDIKSIDRNLVLIEIKESKNLKSDTHFTVTLYQAIPKKTKMDFIVEKAVELGVDNIIPIITERAAASINEFSQKKIDRWIRIGKAASKQCGRIDLPSISYPIDFNNAFIELEKYDLVIFAALDKDAESLKTILKGSNPKNIALFIGPEGDFSQNEISIAKEKGCRICSLGPLVYRVETASIYALSCLNYEYGH